MHQKSVLQEYWLPIIRGLCAEPRTAEAYFQRWLAVKERLEAEPALLERIRSVFRHVYGPQPLPPAAPFIGMGNTHRVYGVGVVPHPVLEEELFVALRLPHRAFVTEVRWKESESDKSLSYGRYNFFSGQLHKFEEAYMNGENPPYFVGLARWRGEGEFSGRTLDAFLVEDLSQGGRCQLRDLSCHEYCQRKRPDGTREEFYMDPILGSQPLETRMPYLTEEMIVHI